MGIIGREGKFEKKEKIKLDGQNYGKYSYYIGQQVGRPAGTSGRR